MGVARRNDVSLAEVGRWPHCEDWGWPRVVGQPWETVVTKVRLHEGLFALSTFVRFGRARPLVVLAGLDHVKMLHPVHC